MTNSLSSEEPTITPSDSSSINHRRKPQSTIDSSVTRLLVSTKHLLESLTSWAKQESDDKFVSDAYVKLGNDFRAATRAFNNKGIDVSDLGDVPQALRAILETALSEAPSQDNLDRFLPNIRNIIVTLLQTLKAKQAKLKSLAEEKSSENISFAPSISSSTASKEEENYNTNKDRSISDSTKPAEQENIPSRRSLQDQTSQNIPQSAPNSNNTTTRITSPQKERLLSPNRNNQNDALSQLQKGDALQRRASKRFSAYQYAKLTNFSQQNALNEMPNTIESQIPPVPKSPEVAKQRRRKSILKTEDEENDTESEFYILLKINERIKKSVVQKPLTLATLRLLFVEKFAYSPGLGNFPDIYIQDPHSKHSYELEESLIGDVKKGSLLSLNEPDVQTKAISDLNSKIELLSSKMESMNSDIIKNVQSSIASIEFPAPTQPSPSTTKATTSNETTDMVSKKELNKIENELRVLKQLNNSQTTSIKESIKDTLTQLETLQETGLDTSQDSNRLYMESCHSKLSDESDMLLTKVDDLQDLMEEMRKDVAQRGVRVGEKQLKNIVKEINDAKTSLNDMNQFILKEKLVWKKIWESELDKVCEEQQFFNLQDDLTNDLQEDLKKIQETFALIEQCSKEQTKNGGSSAKRRNFFLSNIPEPGENLNNVKDAVLIDIQQLNPDHESRVEAIERAEKLREREKQLSRLNKFQEELGDFVEDNKLKKSGGIAELEIQRMQRDKENLKNSFGIV
ncbi:BUD6 [Candida jiufengensis]|uniref:BUD6 n=1 Tax=Candida jiufengensis TaxID=497108 RepID=UPI0022248058|nr:BUD6 [Candida jiufengensis]KAI5951331.1 BUD6 [Candida jiufengensis]